MSAFFGCIADDYTGASDMASQLAEQGVRAVQLFGVPDAGTDIDPEAQAIIIGLKTRTEAVDTAVAKSLAALAYLQQAGCSRFYFKYCSTFDSTAAGNIGQVADALAGALNASPVIFCPAFPKNGRTVYLGHLFVHGALLSESSLATHPLTPMTDANLVRWLGQQTEQQVGLLPVDALDAGEADAQQALDALIASGRQRIVTDTLNEGHLGRLGALCADHALVTGGSALAPALVSAWRARGLMPGNVQSDVAIPEQTANAVILSGSCSEQANLQVATWQQQGGATYFLDPEQLMTTETAVAEALTWVRAQLKDGAVLVYATSPAGEVAALQQRYGRQALGHRIEQAFVDIARAVTQYDTGTLIVAGGETSGAVVAGLNLAALTVGPSIAPGVPWMFRYGEQPLSIALKSGNFGSADFYREALESLQQGIAYE